MEICLLQNGQNGSTTYWEVSELKEHVAYSCEYCYAKYPTKEEAMECERNHKTNLTIVSLMHFCKDDCPDGYPRSIEVKGEDGKTVLYWRDI